MREEKTVLAHSNDLKELEKLIEELYPQFEIIHRGVVQIKYGEDYKYHQPFKIRRK